MEQQSEVTLFTAVRKAIDSRETGPKQKHVRTCIMYSWGHDSSKIFWSSIKILPFLSDEIQTFKALILIHKFIRMAPKHTINEALLEISWIGSIPSSILPTVTRKGYLPLIGGYADYLVKKLQFHKRYINLSQTYLFSEFSKVDKNKVTDPNESYEMLTEIMTLLDLIDSLQKRIFSSLEKRCPVVICRLSAIVPLVEESHAIYLFILEFLKYLHSKLGESSYDSLAHLRNVFGSLHNSIRSFYIECHRHPTILSLITVPELPEATPEFIRLSLEEEQVNNKVLSKATVSLEMQDFQVPSAMTINNNTSLLDFYNENNNNNEKGVEEVRRGVLLEQKNTDLTNNNNNVQQIQEYFENIINQRDIQIKNMQDNLTQANLIYNRDQATILQMQSLLNTNQHQPNTLITSELEKSLSEMQKKYNALAGLYSTLRKEHLEALDRIKKYNLTEKQMNYLLKELEDLKIKSANEALEKNEEIIVLQSGMDQSLLALARLKNGLKQNNNEEKDSFKKIQELQNTHCARLDSIFDGILTECCRRIKSTENKIISVVSVTTTTNQTCTPEHLLTMLDGVIVLSTNFFDSLQAHIINEDNGANQPLAMARASEFAYGLSSFLEAIPSVLADDDIKNMINSGTTVVQVFLKYYEGIRTKSLNLYELPMRPGYVSSLHKAVVNALNSVGTRLEDIVCKKENNNLLDLSINLSKTTDFERIMKEAEEILDNSTIKLNKMVKENNTISITVENKSILNLAALLADSSKSLVRCAAACQKEIVGQDKSGVTPSVFYKKNHRWTQGLVSAAKTIASVTAMLVSSADGLICGRRTLEELIVASREVSSSTIQLVAAARVKAVPGSLLQISLESAASKVNVHANDLVRAAQYGSEKQEEIIDLSSLTTHDIRTQEMDQQVKILTIERDLVAARRRLATLRKKGYKE